MKISPKYGILLLIFSLISILVWRYHNPRRPGFHPVNAIQRRTQVPTNQRLQKSTRESIASRATSSVNGNASTSTRDVNATDQTLSMQEICVTDWTQIANWSIDEFEVELAHQLNPLSSACLKSMVSQLEIPRIRTFLVNCLRQIEVLLPEQLEIQCIAYAVDFRAYVIRQLQSGVEDLTTLSVSDLSNQLIAGMLAPQSMSQQELNRNIAIADALITLEPNIYMAYKSKLLSLLLSEIKFQQAVDPQSYDQLYNELTSFYHPDPQDDIVEEAQALNDQIILDDNLPSSDELIGIDDDLVHLPFLRLSALGNLDEMELMAWDYREAYPDSYIGAYYLAEVAWKRGDQAEALILLQEAQALAPAGDMLIELFQKGQQINPMERLYQMLQTLNVE